MLFYSCQDGPKAVFNEKYTQFNPKNELAFSKLVGEYILDNDSKLRYKIEDSFSYSIELKRDTTIIANPFIDPSDNKIFKQKKGKLFYINDFKNKPYAFYLDSKDGNWNNNIKIYSRNKDSALALYIYTPPMKGQNNGDYLRYIKVK